jgi:putative glycosyltransferase (TIGR04372 family)
MKQIKKKNLNIKDFFLPFNYRNNNRLLKKFLKKINDFFGIFLIPLFFIFSIKIFRSSTEALGHQIMDIELHKFLKKKQKIIIPTNFQFIGNRHFFFNYQNNRIFITTDNFYLSLLLFYQKKSKYLSFNNLHYSTNNDAIIYKYFDKFKKKTILKKDQDTAKKILKKKNIRLNKKFVCIHVRNSEFKPFDNENFRNCDLRNYEKVISWLYDNNYSIIIMGHRSYLEKNILSKKIKKKVIDLRAFDLDRDYREILDIYFCSKCVFFIASNSGLQYLPAIFNTPVLLTNAIPLGHIYPPQNNALALPKIYKNRTSSKFLKINEICERGIYEFRSDIQFKKLNILAQENTAKEILAATKEFISMIKNKKYGDKTKIQKKVKKILNKNKNVYSAYSSATLSNNFLKKRKNLFI